MACVLLMLVAASVQVAHACRINTATDEQPGSGAPEHQRSCALCASAHAAPLTAALAQVCPGLLTLEAELLPVAAVVEVSPSSVLRVRPPPAR
ncbi:MAG: hypothetical protein ACE14L_07955 [Terriglobales bacterium]